MEDRSVTRALLVRCFALIGLGLLCGTNLVPFAIAMGSLVAAFVAAIGLPRGLRGWGLSMSGMAMCATMGARYTIWMTVISSVWAIVLFAYILIHASKTSSTTGPDPAGTGDDS